MKHFTPTENELIKLLPEAFVVESPSRERFNTFFTTLLDSPGPKLAPEYPKFVSLLFRSPYLSLSVGALAVILVLTGVSSHRLNSVSISKNSYESSTLLSKETFAFLSDEESSAIDSLINEIDASSMDDFNSLENGPDSSELSFESEI